jgi:cytochrome b subunit of formate dehydrogenase
MSSVFPPRSPRLLRPSFRIGALLALLVVVSAPPVARASTPPPIENADCFGCHGDKDFATTGPDGKPRSLFVDEAGFSASIHGHNRCTSCHRDIVVVPHPDGFRPAPVVCSQCHRVESGIYLASDHGLAVHRGVAEAASCKDCHGGTHTLLNSRNEASPVNRRNISRTCGRCHANSAEMKKFHLRQQDPVGTYEHSVHGIAILQKQAMNAAVCIDCHGSHDLHKSTNPASKLYWQRVPETCGKCHENVERTYVHSIHGKALQQGVRDTPVCTDCHGEHTIAAVKSVTSRVSPANVPETCAQCHAAKRIVTQYQLPPDVFSTYVQSFHGLALQGGNPTVANCSSCHGVHDILPSSDPMSSVNPKDLPNTCGKCHPGIGTRLAAEFFTVHAPPGRHADKPWVVNAVTTVYIVLIVLTIGGMTVFVLLDYWRKAKDHVRAVQADPHAEERLSPWLRRQHVILAVLFIVLAYSGFVHKFPDAFFSWPFQAMSNGNAVRALVHRVAGWSFVVFFAVHLALLAGTRAGRRYAVALWFVWDDLKDAWAQLSFNLGWRAARPPARRWNYAEKAEYWALVWGSVVMAITGAMLVFTDAVLRMWPKVWHDIAQVIHFYEAILATLAIVVWHTYWVVFDPAEYPMNPAWLIGRKPRHHVAGDVPAAEAPAATTAEAPASGEPGE